MSKTPLEELSERGQSVWIDSLSREMIESGELERLIREDSVVGVTTNPTIFQKAMASGDAYDDQMREVLESETDAKEVFLALAVSDVRRACDILKPVWDEADEDGGRDGWVSIEVDPNLAFDADETLAEAVRLNQAVDRPNAFVKIPATTEGLGAIENAIAQGIPINVTLIFSLERYRRVAEAYLRGLERLVEDGGDPSGIASVASFFVSRVDTEADKRLDEIGGHDELKGKLAIANAKLAYEAYKQIFSGDRWDQLQAKGATPQRCLWASTSTKNPDYRDVMYVEELIGPQTVNTMPAETVTAFQDHGEVRGDTVEEALDEAHALLEKLDEAGVDYDDVTVVLEREGVEKFADSFKELLEGVAKKRDALVAA
ncbi:MAG: transaldolase [Thermoleophilaceae bacterium]|jgi:transaldolase|nr:transaldolase [Thermoleophilaceae bacterium]